MSQYYELINYGLNQPLIKNTPAPVIARRAPTTADNKYALGQLWIEPKNTSNVAQNLAWILTSVINNSANWLALVGGGGAGSFASLVVTPGPISLTGTTTINTTGSAVTTIGTGGTGAVNIGNATGNVAVTGTLTSTVGLTAGTSVVAGTGITATTGNITASDGNVVLSTAGTYVSLPGPVFIYSVAGAPSNGLALHTGDLYINTSAASTSTRLYIATGAGAWTYFTSNA